MFALEFSISPGIAMLKQVLIFLFLLVLLQPNFSFGNDRIKIGVVSPLSGDAATYGQDLQDFLRFADSKLGKNRFELIFEDDKCSGKEAVTAANKLINVDRVRYTIGFACSGATLAALPLYERAKILTMVAFASSPKIRDAGDYIFRIYPSDAAAGAILADYVSANQKSVAILSEQTDYAQDLKNAFISSAGGSRLKISFEDFLPDTSDFRAILLKLKSQNAESIFINPQTERGMAVILKQLREIKWKPAIYGAYWPASPSLKAIAASDLEGIVFVDTPALDAILDQAGRNLLLQYKNGGGKIRSTEAVFATAFEGYRALTEAISSSPDPKKYLYDTKFNGIFGPYSFDSFGEVQGISLILKKILPQGRSIEIH